MYANLTTCEPVGTIDTARHQLSNDNPTIAACMEVQSIQITDITAALQVILEAMSGPCKLLEDRPDGSKPCARSMCSDLRENNDRLQYCFRLTCAIKDTMGIG